MNKIISMLLVILFLSLAYLAFGNWKPTVTYTEPIIVPVTVTAPVPAPVSITTTVTAPPATVVQTITTTTPPITLTVTAIPETITKTITTTQTATVVDNIYVNTFEWFGSYEELAAWLAGVEDEIKAARQPDWNCQDFVWWLVERAQADCYQMVFFSIQPETYNACFTIEISAGHAIAATYINNHTYLIEPQYCEIFPNHNIGGE